MLQGKGGGIKASYPRHGHPKEAPLRSPALGLAAWSQAGELAAAGLSLGAPTAPSPSTSLEVPVERSAARAFLGVGFSFSSFLAALLLVEISQLSRAETSKP